MMSRNQVEKRMLSRLYGECTPSEAREFDEAIVSFPDLQEEYTALQTVREELKAHLKEAGKSYQISSDALEEIIRKAKEQTSSQSVATPPRFPQANPWYRGLFSLEWLNPGVRGWVPALGVALVAGVGWMQIQDGAILTEQERAQDSGQPVSNVTLSSPNGPSQQEGAIPPATSEAEAVKGEKPELIAGSGADTEAFNNGPTEAVERTPSSRGRKGIEGAPDSSRGGKGPTSVSSVLRGKTADPGVFNQQDPILLGSKKGMEPTESLFSADNRVQKRTATLGSEKSSASEKVVLAPSTNAKKRSVQPPVAFKRMDSEKALHLQKQAKKSRPSAALGRKRGAFSGPAQVLNTEPSAVGMGGAAAAEPEELKTDQASTAYAEDTGTQSPPSERLRKALEQLNTGEIEKGISLLERIISDRNQHSSPALTQGVQALLQQGLHRKAGLLLGYAEQTGNPDPSWPLALKLAREWVRTSGP